MFNSASAEGGVVNRLEYDITNPNYLLHELEEKTDEEFASIIESSFEIEDSKDTERIVDLRKDIARLENQKEERLQRLEDEESSLRYSSKLPFENKLTTLVYQDGAFYLFEGKEPFSYADLIEAFEWGGQEYWLNETVPVEIRRRYAEDIAERSIRNIEYHQEAIALAKGRSAGRIERMGYEFILKKIETSSEQLSERGEVAEKVAMIFLDGLAIEHDLPFRVIPASPTMDVENKVDFVIDVDSESTILEQGVNVEEGDHTHHTVGIQLTTALNRAGLREKRKDVRTKEESTVRVVDHTVLVKIPPRVVNGILDQKVSLPNTKKDKRPMKITDHLTDEDKSVIFFKTLENVIKPKERLDEMWAKIQARTSQ